MSGWFASAATQWGFNKQVNGLKKEVNDMFGGDKDDAPPVYLDDEPDIRYDKDEHRSYTAKRADAARAKAGKNVKSDAVKAAMERRAAAQAAAAAKSRR